MNEKVFPDTGTTFFSNFCCSLIQTQPT